MLQNYYIRILPNENMNKLFTHYFISSSVHEILLVIPQHPGKMSRNLENQTISLNLERNNTHNDFQSWIYVVEANDYMSPRLLEKPEKIQWFTLSGYWFSILIGTYFRFIVYEYLFQQHKNQELTAVNKLSLVGILTQHLSRASITLALTVTVLNGESLHQVAGGHWYCILQRVYCHFSFYYFVIGSLKIHTISFS